MIDDDAELWLFSYGTLRQREVQRHVFGRELDSVEDGLRGYEVAMLRITDQEVIRHSGSDLHPVLERGAPDAFVPGQALRVEEADLAAADRYEVDDYQRILVVLASGRSAFAYVRRGVTPSSGGLRAAAISRRLVVTGRVRACSTARG